MGTGFLSPVDVVDDPTPPIAQVKERVKLYLYSPLELHGLF
jgi:hypothetical protein